MITRIFMDMDDTLVDFMSGIAEWLGKAHLKSEVTSWDLPKHLGVADSLIEDVMRFPVFWEKLPWTAKGPEIISLAMMAVSAHNVYLLSAVDSPGGLSGKQLWIEKHLPYYRKRRIFVSKVDDIKGLLAAPDRLLIDDADHNVEAWRAAGGPAILVPQPWNANRGKPVLKTVSEELKRLR